MPIPALIGFALKAALASGAIPEVVKALAGEKAGEAAERLADTAMKVTGLNDREKALKAVVADPALAARLQEKLIDERLEYARLEHADREGARARDVEVRKLSGGKNRRADVMVIGAVVGLISCLLVLAFFRDKVPGEVVGIVSTIAGIFGACLRDAFQFEFGSSRGSRDKDELLAKR